MVQMVQSVATIASTTVQEQVDNAHKTPLSPNGNNDGSFEGKDGKEQDDDDVEDDRKPAAVNDHEHEHDDNDNDSISSTHSSSSSSSGSGTSTSSTNTVNSSHGNQVDTEGHDGNGENNVDTNNNTTNKARDGLSDYERYVSFDCFHGNYCREPFGTVLTEVALLYLLYFHSFMCGGTKASRRTDSSQSRIFGNVGIGRCCCGSQTEKENDDKEQCD
jgi:hypothetical protein